MWGGFSTLALTVGILIGGRMGAQESRLGSLERRLSREVAELREKSEKYAVMISGESEKRHRENLALAYDVLLENGFRKRNIYILDDKGEKRSAYPVDGLASKGTIKAMFDNLGKRIDSNDLLFVYTTGHGERVIFRSEINGKRHDRECSRLKVLGDVSEDDMAEYLEGVHVGVGVVVSDQCYGGGFAEAVGKGNYIGISASGAGQISESNTFAQAFFNSWRDKMADTNRDERTSIREAYEYANAYDINAHSGKQMPRLCSDVDADRVFLK